MGLSRIMNQRPLGRQENERRRMSLQFLLILFRLTCLELRVKHQCSLTWCFVSSTIMLMEKCTLVSQLFCGINCKIYPVILPIKKELRCYFWSFLFFFFFLDLFWSTGFILYVVLVSEQRQFCVSCFLSFFCLEKRWMNWIFGLYFQPYVHIMCLLVMLHSNM